VRKTRGRVVHIESLEDLDARLATGTAHLSGWRVHGLDLTGRTDVLLARRYGGATFLGCSFRPGVAEQLQRAGAIVMPRLADVAVDPYRSRLYTAEELYDAATYAESFDARAYAWSQEQGGQDDLLARALHDHAVDVALTAWVGGRRLVGVMGGHAAVRGHRGYLDAAELGQRLGLHHTVATGGGPGAMEAANLGARLSGHGPEAVLEAVLVLERTPGFRPSVDRWLDAAREVLSWEPDAVETLGVPTWHYGHEPSNVFATAIAKYLGNPTREAVLLEICDAGIVFLPGAAGTVQEVFQDACENYYADESSVAPMVLVGRTYWTETLPAWPLLRTLAQGRAMEEHVHLVDTVAEAVEVVGGA
jgi:predicted Rossmann-fold nucleotide-binding protein